MSTMNENVLYIYHYYLILKSHSQSIKGGIVSKQERDKEISISYITRMSNFIL